MTNLEKQYHDAKAACGNALLLIRMGDFYEAFNDDAKEVARILGLSLTTRSKGDNATPMAGFPAHYIDSYTVKLMLAGKRVAICDVVNGRLTSSAA